MLILELHKGRNKVVHGRVGGDKRADHHLPDDPDQQAQLAYKRRKADILLEEGLREAFADQPGK